jgi:L-aminopeptidase/D-esterase-like protein
VLRRLLVFALIAAAATAAAQDSAAPRARDLGVPFDGTPGSFNAITDVPGVLVGHTTLLSGDGARAVRTGVTAILPRRELGYYPASTFVLNGDAELSGAIFAEEFGLLRSPIMLTGTASNGTVYTAVIKWSARRFPDNPVHMPVVADTWDADLSDYLAFPLREEHVFAALDNARTGPVPEGNVGGGTGMTCHEFKCGIGTASRVLAADRGGFVVGVLVQANYGRREELRVAGVPVGREITTLQPEFRDAAPEAPEAGGSVLVVVATNAPVSALTLKAMARRATLGLARNGATATPGSGDVVIAFATTPITVEPDPPHRVSGETIYPYATEALYQATIQATEEAVINALVAGRTMTGRNGSRVHGIPHDALREVLRKYGRL